MAKRRKFYRCVVPVFIPYVKAEMARKGMTKDDMIVKWHKRGVSTEFKIYSDEADIFVRMLSRQYGGKCG